MYCTTISKSTKKRYRLRSATWTTSESGAEQISESGSQLEQPLKVGQAMQLELTPPQFSARREVKYHNKSTQIWKII